MDRYSLIHTKMPREFVLLQGAGCKWKKCTFCDYHEDVSSTPFVINEPVLRQVTGEYGVLDVINSGSAMELDSETIALIKEVVREKQIHTLWFEAHYMYRKKLAEFAKQFEGVSVKFRCGVETFDVELRDHWKKGIPSSVTPEDIAEHFQGVCLLLGTEGETKAHVMSDIEIAKKHFEYFSMNVFCNNSTPVKQDKELAKWFAIEVYPHIKNEDGIEVLMENTDLGVG